MSRRTFAAIALTACLAGPVAADSDYPPMHPKGMKVGNAGNFMRWKWTVGTIIDERSAVVSLPTFPDNPVVVKGFDFKRLADGSEVTLPGEWKVTGTEKRGGRTLFVVEPQPPGKE
jgi:hypothetical protein